MASAGTMMPALTTCSEMGLRLSLQYCIFATAAGTATVMPYHWPAHCRDRGHNGACSLQGQRPQWYLLIAGTEATMVPAHCRDRGHNGACSLQGQRPQWRLLTAGTEATMAPAHTTTKYAGIRYWHTELANPRRTATYDPAHPTCLCFLLSTIAGTAHHEYLHPTPLGFYFRKKLHAKEIRVGAQAGENGSTVMPDSSAKSCAQSEQAEICM
eukprot:1155370-Pelagomonas_calceolata.AAC.1